MIDSEVRFCLAMLGCLFGTLVVTSCQAPRCHGLQLDPTVMGDGTTNMTNLGGYWWTLVDRSGTSRVTPFTGKLDPNDTSESPQLHPSLRVGSGLEEDETGNFAFHITGSVGSALEDQPPEQWRDVYWNAFYASICEGGDCGEYVTPQAGLGFSFKRGSAPLGDDARDAACVSFRIKLGLSHDGLAEGQPHPVTIMLPMDVTEPPDPTFQDRFGTMYDEAVQSPVLYPNQSAQENYPLCAFAGSLKADGSGAQGRTNRTCFCHFETTLRSLATSWKTFTLPWSSFSSTECPALASVAYPLGGVTEIIPQRLIQMRFDAYRPLSSEPPAAFDFWVDDVRLLAAADCS